jgi:hypothetical protein
MEVVLDLVKIVGSETLNHLGEEIEHFKGCSTNLFFFLEVCFSFAR